ncbi:MAG: beta-N-acetylhexosaminidase [Nitrospinota bacterium]|nr:beta-N-acetylhexosaminidase [Nitrospinota bacterium]
MRETIFNGDSSLMAGQLLVVGFEGMKYTRELGTFFQKVQPGGAILFSRNIRDTTQTRILVGDIARLIEDTTGARAFICLDQEGGRVSRLPGESFPTARQLCQKGGEEAVEASYRAMGEKMAGLGFNVNFAPVLDLDTNPINPIIGDRAFGPDVETVMVMAAAAKRGLDAAGVLSCGKHFPGHGGADKDSHMELPLDMRPLERLLEREVAPFAAWSKARGPFIMTAHVAYPALDNTMLPATLSKPMITGLLRERLEYQGIVITDDMDMKALTDNHDDREAALMALGAGCDILLSCHDPSRITAIHETIRGAFDGGLPEEEMIAKLGRVMNIKDNDGIMRDVR